LYPKAGSQVLDWWRCTCSW